MRASTEGHEPRRVLRPGPRTVGVCSSSARQEVGILLHDVQCFACGTLLRKLEAGGLYHWDAKASNWIVQMDELTGPQPIMVDVDGVRNNWGTGEGIRRLLLSMREHPQYTPEDSLNLCRGYAPFAPIGQ